MSGFSEWMRRLDERRPPQAITEDFGGLPHEVPIPENWMREHIEQRTREIEEISNRYAEILATEHREAEERETRARVIHHMWHPSDDEGNDSNPPRWSFEREHHLDLSFDSETGEITSLNGTLPTEEVLFNPGTVSTDSLVTGTGVTTISCTEPTWELSVSDAITDKYKEMEKRVEEQDKTIAEMKSIIENLQEIVYQRKLDKEAETLVL